MNLTCVNLTILGNCNTILLVMSCIFIVGGVILAAISYRPRDPNEDLEQYKSRLLSEDGLQIKIAAPIFLLIGVIMLICATVLYILRYFVKKRERESAYELSNGLEILSKSTNNYQRPNSRIDRTDGPIQVPKFLKQYS